MPSFSLFAIDAPNRWIAIRMDGLGTLFVTGLAFYMVYGPFANNPSSVGFSLNMAS
jgi:hypothetical protein